MLTDLHRLRVDFTFMRLSTYFARTGGNEMWKAQDICSKTASETQNEIDISKDVNSRRDIIQIAACILQ